MKSAPPTAPTQAYPRSLRMELRPNVPFHPTYSTPFPEIKHSIPFRWNNGTRLGPFYPKTFQTSSKHSKAFQIKAGCKWQRFAGARGGARLYPTPPPLARRAGSTCTVCPGSAIVGASKAAGQDHRFPSKVQYYKVSQARLLLRSGTFKIGQVAGATGAV